MKRSCCLTLATPAEPDCEACQPPEGLQKAGSIAEATLKTNFKAKLCGVSLPAVVLGTLAVPLEPLSASVGPGHGVVLLLPSSPTPAKIGL